VEVCFVEFGLRRKVKPPRVCVDLRNVCTHWWNLHLDDFLCVGFIVKTVPKQVPKIS
jgi:hypothetical protein